MIAKIVARVLAKLGPTDDLEETKMEKLKLN